MKKLATYFSVFILLLIAACKPTTTDPTTITILGENLSNAKIQWPVNGNWFLGDTTYTAVGDSGIVAKRMITQTGFAMVTVGYKGILLIVSPGKSYEITVAENPIIKGFDEKGQQGLQALLKEYYSGTLTNALCKIENVADLKPYAEKVKEQTLAPFSELLKQNEISQQFYNLVEVERNVYAEFSLAQSLVSKFIEKIEMPKDTSYLPTYKEKYLPMFEGIYKNSDTRTDVLQTYYHPLWFETYRYYEEIRDSAKITYETTPAKSYAFLKKHFTGNMLEYLWGTQIICHSESYDIGWAEGFNEFKTIFPQSKLIQLIQPSVDKIIAFNKAKQQVHEGIVFLDNENINTFADLTKKIKGKVTYIDIWATWCGPCRGELPHSVKMHEQLEAMGVQMLYLSVDKEKNATTWKDMVNGLTLNGTHIHASAKLLSDIRKSVPDFGGIPRYIILDKTGKPVVWDAKRPSSGNELVEQLKEYL